MGRGGVIRRGAACPSPDGTLMLGGLQQASVVGHDLVFGQVQVELQSHQDGKLEGDQLPAVHPETLFKFIDEDLDFVLLQVSPDLGGQQHTRAGAQFAVLFVQFALKNQFLEVDKSHGHRQLLVAALVLSQFFDLPLQAPDLAERESDVWKLLLESLVHVLLQVRRLHVFNHCGHI